MQASDIELFTAMTGTEPHPLRPGAGGGDPLRRHRRPGRGDHGAAERPRRRGPAGAGSVFLQVSWRFLAPVRPGDVLTAEARVLEVRADKPVTTLETTVRTGDGTLVVDGTAVVWRDPVVQALSHR